MCLSSAQEDGGGAGNHGGKDPERERRWQGTPTERQVAGSPGPFSRIKRRTREATLPAWRSCLGHMTLKKKKQICGGKPWSDLGVSGLNTEHGSLSESPLCLRKHTIDQWEKQQLRDPQEHIGVREVPVSNANHWHKCSRPGLTWTCFAWPVCYIIILILHMRKVRPVERSLLIWGQRKTTCSRVCWIQIQPLSSTRLSPPPLLTSICVTPYTRHKKAPVGNLRNEGPDFKWLG